MQTRVYMLGWELPPHNSGGLGVACYYMTRALANRGIDIDFMLPYELESKHAPFMQLVAGQHAISPEEYMRYGAYDSAQWMTDGGETEHRELPALTLRQQQAKYVAAVRSHAKEHDYDIIHAHDWLTYEGGMEAQSILGKPLITHVHATEYDRAGGGRGNELVHDIEYQGMRRADHVIAVSDFTRKLIMQKYGISGGKISVVHNSIDGLSAPEDTTEQTYRYLMMKKAQGHKIVISVGRLTIQKGLEYLLRAFKIAVEQQPKLILVLAGNGEQYHELVQLAADLGVGRQVLFTGFVRGKAWSDIFEIADAFVMPSVSEPFGLVALEAAGFGNAVLISYQSGAGEVLKNVLRFDYWDTDKLGNQIAAVATYDNLCSTLRTQVRAEFDQLSWSDAAATIHDIYSRHQGAYV